jgi:hypothetical protein
LSASVQCRCANIDGNPNEVRLSDYVASMIHREGRFRHHDIPIFHPVVVGKKRLQA